MHYHNQPNGMGMGMGYGGQGFNQQDSNPSCRQQAAQFTNWENGAIPPYPQMPDIHPSVQAQIPSMAVFMAKQMQNQANTNPAFMFLFNTVATANYNSPFWSSAVQFSVMLLWQFMDQRPNASLPNLMLEAAATTVIYKASSLAVTNQIVFNALDQATRQEVQAFSQEHDGLRNAFAQRVAQYAQQVQMQNNPQQVYGGLVGQTMQNRLNQNQQQQVNTGSFYSAPQPASQGSYPISSPPRSTPKPKGKSQPLMSLDDDIPEPATGMTAFRDPIPEGAFANNSMGTVTDLGADATPHQIQEPVGVTEDNWVPTRFQPYRPLICTTHDKLVYEMAAEDDGSAFVFASTQLKTEDEMNREDYNIPVLNRTIGRAMEKRHGDNNALVADMDLIAKGIRATECRLEPETVAFFKKVGLDESNSGIYLGKVHSMNQAIASMREEYLAEEEKPSIYCTQADLVDNAIVTESPIDDVIEKLRLTTNFSQGANYINTEFDNLADDAEGLIALLQLDQHLTNMFNQELQYGIGLTGWMIDSYRADAVTIIEGIRTHKGRGYAEAFTKKAEEFFKKAIACIDKKVIEIEGREGPIGYEYTISSKINLIYIGLDSKNLAFELKPGEARELLNHNYPGLHAMLHEVSELKNADYGVFLTADGERYAFRRSLLNDTILIVNRL